VPSASGCQAALEILRGKDKVDLVMLDYLMPDGLGTDLLKFVGEEKDVQRPPVIMVSAVLDPNAPLWERLRKFLPPESQSLIQAYITKPYTLDAVDVAVTEVLGGDYIPEPRATRQSQKTR